MLKRLFGKKKAMKPESLVEAKELLLESISEESLNKHVAQNLGYCIDFFEEVSEKEIEDLKQSVFVLTQMLPVAQSSVALSVFCSLIERGLGNESDVSQIIDLYSEHLTNTLPFFKLLDQNVKAGEEGDAEVDIDVDSLYHELVRDRNLISEDIASSVTSIELFAQNIISVLSISPTYIEMGRCKLKDDISFAKDYNQGAYWIARLFGVMFDEPIVVIDVDNHCGFEGKMSGVNDNYQMQHLLMGMPELNEHLLINEYDLSVVNGTGIHISNAIQESKWNMYNYEICEQEGWDEIKIGPAKTMELQDFWVWGEGTPREISVRNGRRVVLLGRSSYKKSTRIQRVFKNMKASIAIEKMLTDAEIDTWLGY